ncbi:MAG: DegT/DnrJ/EryC1/StrS family aminotransferase, partial [Lacisediminihabitans sp.]
GEIQRLRTAVWDRYWAELATWAADNGIGEMTPPGGIHASHLFYLLMPTWTEQTRFIAHLRTRGVQAAFHYVPLDSSPAGLRYGRTLHPLDRSEDFSRRLVRLPLWAGMAEDAVSRVIEAALDYRVSASG